MRDFLRIALALCCALAVGVTASKADNAAVGPSANTPPPLRLDLSPNDAANAQKQLRPAPGLKLSLWASEPLIANPVSFTFDEQGRVYVVETHRRRTSVLDIRNHTNWLEYDLSFRTVADRSNYFRKVMASGATNLPEKFRKDFNRDGVFDWRDFEIESEAIRLLEDTTGSGRADQATTYADGFSTLVSGVAAGVLTRRGDVWFTCIPDLWRLKDSDHDGKADARERLHHGFGVHIAFGGHDMHGLTWGPDGRLYFSIADRGFDVTTPDGHLSNPDSGAVLRCWPDGHGLEVFATGLRNPQELAFDQFGNLWTGDNNADGGDKARWVHLIEGGDSGWRIGWQHLPKLGAWNSEFLWHLAPTNTAAYLIPPVAHIGHGPAGLAFYPGTGLPVQYHNHFLMCDFPGGVLSFSLQPSGATYALTNLQPFLQELSPVDVTFGVEGGAYVLDWVQGWEKTGRGRIWHLTSQAEAPDPLVAEVKTLLREGMAKRSVNEIMALLGHVDQRVRQEAQFTLAERGNAVLPTLFKNVARSTVWNLQSLHALWAIGQIAQASTNAQNNLISLAEVAADPELRAQVFKLGADLNLNFGGARLRAALGDPSPRVRFYAAYAVGHCTDPDAPSLLLEYLGRKENDDAFLRHAAVMSLTRLKPLSELAEAAGDGNRLVRLGAMLVLRRLSDPAIAKYLSDADPRIQLEAARAIHEVPIDAASSSLAALADKPQLSDGLQRRALAASFRKGEIGHALQLAEAAGQTTRSPAIRAEALDWLGRWESPGNIDPITGLYRPLANREPRAARLALESAWGGLQLTNEQIGISALGAAQKLDLSSVSPSLAELVGNEAAPSKLRVASLRLLAVWKSSELGASLGVARTAHDSDLRNLAGLIEAGLDETAPTSRLADWLKQGDVPRQRIALGLLSHRHDLEAEQALKHSMDLLVSGKLPRALELDVVEAALGGSGGNAKAAAFAWRSGMGPSGSTNAWSDCLEGGNPEQGQKIFLQRADLGCLRCHHHGKEGGDVGPDLSLVGSRLTRSEILESIVLPNARIAAGFAGVTIETRTGQTVAGTLRKESNEGVEVASLEDGLVRIPASQISKRIEGLSAMPTDLVQQMTRRDLRDLIEFLATSR